MNTYHGYTKWLLAALLCLTIPVQAQSWDTEREQGLGRDSWRTVVNGERGREPTPPEIAMNLAAQALRLATRGNYSKAESLLRKSLEITSQALGTDHPQIAVLWTKLAGLYVVQHRYGEAERLLRLSLEINEAAFGPEHLDVAANLEALALVLKKAHRDEEAKQMEIRAYEIWSKHRNDDTLRPAESPPG